tara:strand:+ start:1758 stop:2591 length:834 start_codon:yes stop_codon:yes gene_type:complete
MAYATGKHSLAICDRCGFRYKYTQLRKEWTGFFVCSECYEPKEPQLDPVPHVADPEALRNPRTQVPSSLVAGEGVVRTIDANSMMTTTGDSIGSAFSLDAATGQVGTVTTTQNVPVNIATPDGVSATSRLGSVSVIASPGVVATPTGLAGTASLGTVSVTSNVTTYTVTVATGTNSYGTGNKFYIDGSVSPTLTLTEGQTYKFDQSDSTNGTHPLRFSTTANGSHGGGSEYTTGVTTNGTPGSSGAYTQITVASGAPTLYYYCTNHSGMGGTANTPS